MHLPYVYKYIYIDVCPKPHAIKIDGFSLLLQAVRQTKASWLLHFASPELREDPGSSGSFYV